MSEKLSKKLEALLIDLASTNEQTVLKALGKLRKEGKPSTIKAIIALLTHTNSEVVYTEVCSLLNDLRDQKCIEHVMEGIYNAHDNEHRRVLIESLWQSKLDASNYIGIIVDNAIQHNYLVCIECLTVIENLAGPFDDDELFGCINQLNDAAATPTDKSELLLEVADVLQGYIGE